MLFQDAGLAHLHCQVSFRVGVRWK